VFGKMFFALKVIDEASGLANNIGAVMLAPSTTGHPELSTPGTLQDTPRAYV
jgi:hypothetical protein